MSDITKYLTSKAFKSLIESEYKESDPADVINIMKNKYDVNYYEYIEAAHGGGYDESVQHLVEFMKSDKFTEEHYKEVYNAILAAQGKKLKYEEIETAIYKESAMTQGYQSDASAFVGGDTQEKLTNMENNIASLNEGSQRTLDSLEAKFGELQVELEKLTTAVTGVDEESLGGRVESLEKALKVFKTEIKDLAKSASDIEEASVGYKTFFVAASLVLLAVAAIVCYKNGKNQDEIGKINNKIDLLLEMNPDLGKPDDDFKGMGGKYNYQNLAKEAAGKAKEMLGSLKGKLSKSDPEEESLLGSSKGNYLNNIRSASSGRTYTVGRAAVEHGADQLKSNDKGRGTFYVDSDDFDYITFDGKKHGLASDDLHDKNKHEDGRLQKLKKSAADATTGLKRKLVSVLDGQESLAKREKMKKGEESIGLLGDANNNELNLESQSGVNSLVDDLDMLGESFRELKNVMQQASISKKDERKVVSEDNNKYEGDRLQELKKPGEDAAKELKRKLANVLDVHESLAKQAKMNEEEKSIGLLGDANNNELKLESQSGVNSVTDDLGMPRDLDKELEDSIKEFEDFFQSAISTKSMLDFKAAVLQPIFELEDAMQSLAPGNSLIDSDVGSECEAPVLQPASHTKEESKIGFKDNFVDDESNLAKLQKSNPNNPFLVDIANLNQSRSGTPVPSTIHTKARNDSDMSINEFIEEFNKIDRINNETRREIKEMIERGQCPTVKELVLAFEGRTKLDDVSIENASKCFAVGA